MSKGLLPEVVCDVGAAIPAARHLISVYALGGLLVFGVSITLQRGGFGAKHN